MWHDHSLQQEYAANLQHGLSLDDLMTPEYSDNQLSDHTTPQELIWEQQFLSQDTEQPDIRDGSQSGNLSSPEFSQSLLNGLRGISTSGKSALPAHLTGAQLLSPQLTTPSPPVQKRQLNSNAQEGASASTSNMEGQGRKRAASNLTLATTQDDSSHTEHGQQYYTTSPIQRSTSPVVIVSSHGNVSSPARPPALRARSSSKRGHQDVPSGHSRGESNDVSTMLMPPSPYRVEVSEENQDNRAGLDPVQRGSEQVSTINELAEGRKLNEKNAEVEDWLSKSETGSGADEPNKKATSSRSKRRDDRPRAYSAGVRLDAMGLPTYSDRGIPGPGVLIDEESEDEYSDDDTRSIASARSSEGPESPPVAEGDLHGTNESSSFPEFEDDSVPPEMEEPLARQFYRRTPWQDPFQGPISDSTRDQPSSSNAAAVRYNQEAAKWESASRAATWGTRRRLSESEVLSIVDGSKVRHLSLAKRGRERGSTLLKQARGLIPRRSNSNIKRDTNPTAPEVSPSAEIKSHMETTTSTKSVQRMPSFGKAKSPQLVTGGAFFAMTGNLAAVGHGGSLTTEPEPAKPEGLKSPLQVLRKARSKSDVGKSPKTYPGLAELMSRHGGPPMPTLASPHMESPQLINRLKVEDDDDEDDEDDLIDDTGVKMDFGISIPNFIPSYDSFRMYARQVNPRVPPYMIDRIAADQVRRYKKLLDTKVKHSRAVQAKKCVAGKFCIELGGQGVLLPPRISAKDPDTTCAQFQIVSPDGAEVDDGALDQGVVTPAQFPVGIPLPPVKRLPAEFECTLCFRVKKFYKPSDWTKHVHEDVQPFSCTFANCTDPKSFKRKADWVRHENERHRRLESWRCSVQECNHVCYRKDNFVQHLVREHKKAEPKMKGRGSVSSKAKAAHGNAWQEDEEVWRLVESCRIESPQGPREEPCKFCNNVCNSWKKLSVHVGKHMEQIALPILSLVAAKEVNPDTIISPIEQNYNAQQNVGPAMQPAMIPTIDQASLSPYEASAHSAYHSSSAGQSPAHLQAHPHNAMMYDQTYYSPQGLSTPGQGQLMQGEIYSNTPTYTNTPVYTPTGMAMQDQFGSINNYPATTYMQTPVTAESMAPTMAGSHATGNMYHGGHAPSHDFDLYGGTPDPDTYAQYTPAAEPMHHYGDVDEHGNSNHRYDASSHPASGYSYNGQHYSGNGHGYGGA